MMEYINNKADMKALLEASVKVFPTRIGVISFPTDDEVPLFGVTFEGGNVNTRYMVVLDRECANDVAMSLLNLIVNSKEL